MAGEELGVGDDGLLDGHLAHELVSSPRQSGSAHRVVEDLGKLASHGGEDLLAPSLETDQRHRQVLLGEPAEVGRLEGVRLEAAAHGSAVEEERVERGSGSCQPHAVEHGDEADGLDLDAGLFLHLLDHHLCSRVADIAPAGRIEPDPESARWIRRSSPSSLLTAAPTATLGVT